MRQIVTLVSYSIVLLVALFAPVIVCAQADEDEDYDVAFGTMPTFFTGSGNLCALNVDVYGSYRLASVRIWIGADLVFDESYDWTANKTHRPVNISWDSSRFDHGHLVSYSASVKLWTSNSTQMTIERSAQPRSVYNRYTVFADANLKGASSEFGVATSILQSIKNAEQSAINSDTWTTSDFVNEGLGIVHATSVHFAGHGTDNPGRIYQPDWMATVDASMIASAMQIGQPANRPPANFAFLSACWAASDQSFAESLLEGAAVLMRRAVLGHRVRVDDKDAKNFATYVYDLLGSGHALYVSAYEAHNTVWYLQPGPEADASFGAKIAIWGDGGFKLYGAYRGLGGSDQYTGWFYVYPEES